MAVLDEVRHTIRAELQYPVGTADIIAVLMTVPFFRLSGISITVNSSGLVVRVSEIPTAHAFIFGIIVVFSLYLVREHYSEKPD